MECRDETTYEDDKENNNFSIQIQTTEEEGLEYYLVNVFRQGNIKQRFYLHKRAVASRS